MIIIVNNAKKSAVSGGGGGGSANGRYWVGGSGIWDPTDTTHWSTSSGGPGGASVPTYLDNVFFDANSVSSVNDGVQIYSDIYHGAVQLYCQDLNFTGFIGKIYFYDGMATYHRLWIGGNLNLGTTANTEPYLGTNKNNGVQGYFTLTCNTSPITIVTNNTIWGIPIEINAYYSSLISNPVVNLNGDLFLSTTTDYNYSSSPYSYLNISGGTKQLTFNTNNYNIETNRLVVYSNTTVNLGSSLLTSQWINFPSQYASNTKINAGTSTINLWPLAGFKQGSENLSLYDSYNYVNFGMGQQNLYDINFNANRNPSKYTNLYSSNTIHNLTNSVYNINVGLSVANTYFTGAFDIKGTANNLTNVGYLDSYGGYNNLYQSSGNVSVDYITLTGTHVGGGATWYAGANSVNIANNAGWAFTNGPGGGGSSRTNVYATGGTIIDLPLYRVHVFNASSTFATTSIWPSNLNIEYLVVAGGGGGSEAGGGAGGVLNVKYRTVFSPSTNYTITVGAGGSAASDDLGTLATNGSNSSIIGGSTSIIAIGGGYGATGAMNGGNGGSGGGGGTDTTSTGYSGGLGVPGQGFNGNSGTYTPGKFPFGSESYSFGNGGSALGTYKGDKTSMLGTDLYTGGGGGFINNDTYPWKNGNELYGGGANAYGPHGLPNTGGGGGPQFSSPLYGNGGSGIVIIRYRYPG